MKYRVGDKVRVRGDLEVGERYGDDIFTGEMEKYKGKIAKIAKETCVGYELEDFMYNWTFEMLRPAEFKIWCETEEEKQAVLEELEKEGYVWNNSRKKPTENINDIISCTCPIGFYLREDSLSYGACKGNFKNRSIDEFSPFEFTGMGFSEKIVIIKTPTGATATYGDKTITTEGDFENAARQALAEVLCPFKVGNKVRVKGDKRDVYRVESIKAKTEVTVSGASIYSGGTWLAESLEHYTEPSYNAKLFCIKGSGTFEQGVVYAVENGVFTGVHGSHFKNLDDINKNLTAQFMEIKGGLDD